MQVEESIFPDSFRLHSHRVGYFGNLERQSLDCSLMFLELPVVFQTPKRPPEASRFAELLPRAGLPCLGSSLLHRLCSCLWGLAHITRHVLFRRISNRSTRPICSKLGASVALDEHRRSKMKNLSTLGKTHVLAITLLSCPAKYYVWHHTACATCGTERPYLTHVKVGSQSHQKRRTQLAC